MKGKYKARKVAAGYGPRHALNAQEGTSDTSGYNPSGFYGNVLQPQDVEKMRQAMQAPGRSSLSPIEETLAANPDAQSFYYDQTSGNYVPFGGASGYQGGAVEVPTGIDPKTAYPLVVPQTSGSTSPDVATPQESAALLGALKAGGIRYEDSHEDQSETPESQAQAADMEERLGILRDVPELDENERREVMELEPKLWSDSTKEKINPDERGLPQKYMNLARGSFSVGPRHADNAFAGGESNIKPGSINDEVPLPVQGNTEEHQLQYGTPNEPAYYNVGITPAMDQYDPNYGYGGDAQVYTPTDTSGQDLTSPDLPPIGADETANISPGQLEIINALGYDPSQNQGAGSGGMQLFNDLGYDPSYAYGSAGSGVPTQNAAGIGGQLAGGLLGNLLFPGLGGLVGSQLGKYGAQALTRSAQGGQVPWQTPSSPSGGGGQQSGSGLADFFPGDAGGLGQPMGYFPWYSPGETGSSSYAPFTGGVGGEGGTLGNSDMSNVGAGPLPGSFAGLGSFGGGDLGSYGGGIGEHTPSFQAWVQGQGFPNVASYQAAMAGPPGPTMAMAGGGGGAPVGLQHATGGHITTAQTGKSNVHSTDTVPAMLTPREAVLNRNAAELAGRGKIQELNAEGNQLADEGVDLAGKDKNMKQKYQRGAARIAPVPLTGPKPTARADLAGIMKYLPMGQLARSAQSQAVMPKVGVRGYQAGTSATDPLSMYQNKLSTSPLGGGQSLGGGPGPSPFPGPSPTPNPGPGPMPVSTTPPPYGGRPVPTLGGAPAVPPRPDAGKDPTGAMSTPLSFNNWAANAGAPGFVTQPVPPQGPSMPPKGSQPSTPPNITIPPLPQSSGAAPPITTRTPPPLPSASFFPPPGPAQRTPPPLGFQGGTIDAPQAGTQFANVQYSAPQINIAALKQHLQSQGIQPNQISGIINQIQQYRASTPAASYGEGSQVSQDLGPALEAGFPGYQGGISDIGYPPMVGPNMVYHADKGSNWIGQFDPRYTFQRYWRGTGAVMPMGAGLGPVMGARPFVHPVRPVPPLRF